MTKPFSRIFVYGSLLKGLGNHRVLGGSTLIGSTSIEPDPDHSFEMVDMGSFPGVRDTSKDRAQTIVGEVYFVGPSVLEALDRLEGAPDFYQRREVRLSCGTIAETYILNPEGRTWTFGSRIAGNVADWRQHRLGRRTESRWTLG